MNKITFSMLQENLVSGVLQLVTPYYIIKQFYIYICSVAYVIFVFKICCHANVSHSAISHFVTCSAIILAVRLYITEKQHSFCSKFVLPHPCLRLINVIPVHNFISFVFRRLIIIITSAIKSFLWIKVNVFELKV